MHGDTPAGDRRPYLRRRSGGQRPRGQLANCLDTLLYMVANPFGFTQVIPRHYVALRGLPQGLEIIQALLASSRGSLSR